MDANTVEVLRVLIAAVFGVTVVGLIVRGIVKVTSGTIDATVQLPERDVWTYSRTWGDEDDEDFDAFLYDEDDEDWDDERQALRDRLAAALWELRRLKRKARVDDAVAWRLDELARKVQSWEGE